MKYGLSYKSNPVEYKRLQSAYRRANNPVAYLLNQARYRARQKGEVFTLELGDLEIPDTCPVFGIPLFYTAGGRTKNSFSLDRRDNSKGYVKGNVRVVSFWANQMKGDMTVGQVEALLKYMKE